MNPHPRQIYVTGGRGRLASLIADYFRAPAHQITLFSRLPAANFQALDSLFEPGSFAKGGTLLHLAWSTLPATSEQKPESERAHDLPLLERLLASMAASQGKNKTHLVFFSSGGAVYGNAPGRPSREDDPCRPIGRYGKAKVAAESLVEKAAHSGMLCTILRISNPYGYPVPRDRTQGIIPHALRCAVEGQPLTLWGDGTARKDFLYYTDFLSALGLIVEQRLPGTYNLCAGESHSITEVLDIVGSQIGRPVLRNSISAPAWDVHDSRLDNLRLCTSTGWKPQVNLIEGVRRAAAGYVHH